MRRNRKNLPLFLLILCLGTSTANAVESLRFHAESSQGVVHTSMDASLARQLHREATQVQIQARRFFQSLGFNSTSKGSPFVVKVFSDPKIIAKKQGTFSHNETENRGYFNPETFEIGLAYKGDMNETKIILRHEIMHKVFSESVGSDIPVWLNEGLAVLLSQNPEILQSARYDGPSKGLKALLSDEEIQTDSFDSFADLFQQSSYQFYGKNEKQRYARAYLVLAKVYSDHGPRVLGNLIRNRQNPAAFLNSL